jgi:hypothetical protein
MSLALGRTNKKIRFLITGLGKESAILGFPWLEDVNPIIDWKQGTLTIDPVTRHFNERFRSMMQEKRHVRTLMEELPEGSPVTIPAIGRDPDDKVMPEDILGKESSAPYEDKSKAEPSRHETPVAVTTTTTGRETERLIEEVLPSPAPIEDSPKAKTEYRIGTEPGDGEVLLAYITGEPVIGAFTAEEPPLTKEHDETPPTYQKGKGISRLTRSRSTGRLVYSNMAFIRAKTTISQKLAHEKEGDKSQLTLDELLPPKFQEYRTVFEKAALERFPESRTWDHAIDLKPDFVPKDC